MTAAISHHRTLSGRASFTRALRTQLGSAGAQWLAGVGNLGFALVAARLMSPAEFAQLGAFLGGYVLLHLPAAGIGAGAALASSDHATQRRRLLRVGVAAAALLLAAAGPLAHLFSLPVPLVVALAAAAPGASLLGFERGRLFGIDDRRRIAASLLAEPAGRISLGLVGAALAGPTAAAVAVTAAGYSALVAARAGSRASAPAARHQAVAGTAYALRARSATTATFILFAILQQQDLLAAKIRLGPDAAGLFAALSTAGGAVAFATATIPLAVLPATTRTAHTDRVAIALTAAIGAVATLVAALGGGPLLAATFGPDYAGAAPLLAPYVGAMGLLGLGRVLAARRCALGEHAAVAKITAVAVAVHVVGLASFGTTPRGIVGSTLVATAVSAGAMATGSHHVARARRRLSATRSVARGWDVAAIASLTAAATTIRLISTRGLWVDEAITVAQARLPFGEMLAQLRATDVHPPLHHALVWVLVRIAGSGELAVRVPSIVAGALLVPAAYGLARSLYGRRTALITAALVTVAPFAVWYSQEARMYSLFMLFSTTAVWAQVAAIRGGGRWAWAAYAASTAAMAWTQWFAIVPIVAQQIVFLGVAVRRRHERTQRRRFLLVWAAALGAATLALLPLLPVALDQLGAYAGRSGGGSVGAPSQAGSSASGLAGDVSIYAVGANAIWAVVGYHSDRVMTQLAALWPLLLLAGLAALGRGRSGRTTALLTWIALPTLAFVVAGFVKRDLFELRYFAGVVPLVLVLLARGITVALPRPRAQSVVAVAAVTLLLVGLVDQQLNGANPRRYDFEGALDHVVAEADPGDIVLYEPEYLAEVVDYYAPGVEARPIDDRHLVDPDARTWVLATTRVANDKRTSARVGDALADLEQSDRTIVDEIIVPNVHVWELRP